MIYRVPLYYTGFRCTGAACEDTCCRGWQIGIDEESSRYYRSVPGAFGRRLRDNIIPSACAGGEQTFALNGRDCAFLNGEGLCDIYSELGRDKLCRTCRTYPRHMEDYGEFREQMLSLSCPEAARQILGDQSAGAFRLFEKNIGARSEEERELDPDMELLSCMLEARQTMTALVKNRSVGFTKRLAMILAYAHDLQYHMQQVEETSEAYGRKVRRRSRLVRRISRRYLAETAAEDFEEKLEPFCGRAKERRLRVTAWMRFLQKLEPVLSQWEKKQGSICTGLYHRLSEEAYLELERRFAEASAEFPMEWENLFLYFLNTYLLGASYDGDMYSKAKLAVFSVLVIREWCMFRYQKTGQFDRAALVAAAYRYSREVENSDENLEMLEIAFREDPLFRLRSFLTVLAGGERCEF